MLLALLIILVTLLVLFVVSISYQLIGTLVDARIYPPIGKLVDVGGYRLHIVVEGQGSPTVVLDAGLGHTSQVWSLVQAEVAEFTRVCSYDRAGYGWSDPSPLPRTSQQIVQELHILLKNASIPGPYILVGHSFGGLNMYLYALQYPDEVVGLVLIDAVSKDVFVHNSYEFHWFLRGNRIKYRILALLSRLGLFRLYVLLRGPEATMDFIRQLPTQLQRNILSGYMRKTFEAAAFESAHMEEGIRRINEIQATESPLTLPLVVLSHGIPDMFARRMSTEEVEQAERGWQILQAGLVRLSSQGTHIIAEKGGHKIHIDQPALVVDVIRQLYLEAQQESGEKQ